MLVTEAVVRLLLVKLGIGDSKVLCMKLRKEEVIL
jgi:hypothetical protein